jgi:hypothetical protein
VRRRGELIDETFGAWTLVGYQDNATRKRAQVRCQCGTRAVVGVEARSQPA